MTKTLLVSALCIEPGYTKVFLPDVTDLWTGESLARQLAVLGIDTSQPYSQLDIPGQCAHVYCQPPWVAPGKPPADGGK